MILRKIQWLLVLIYLTEITAQETQSYDDNDWIPVTPSNTHENGIKAQGRVLHLNAPNQNSYSDNEYLKRRQPEQYIQETVFQKTPSVLRHHKNEEPYKFETVVPLQPPQYIPQNQFLSQPQFVQQIPYVQTLQQVQQVPTIQKPVQQIEQSLVAPSPNTQNYYNSDKPLNNTFYQSSANAASLNRELLAAIQNQKIDQIQLTTVKPKSEKESVQLLYVPLENLKSNQEVTQIPPRTVQQTEIPRKDKQLTKTPDYRQSQISNIQDDFIRQALAAHKLQQQLQQGEHIILQTTTTTTPAPKPKKRKPNQPPLAVYMEKQGPADVKEVLDILKNAKTISVQDSAGPDSPKIFVGPSNIDPEGYAKFPLPYLSSVQSNRIERKVDDLPFFVAPLSYKTPEGYSKIPLPSPHVGSVVVSNKQQQLNEKETDLNQPQTAQNQIVQDFDIKQPFVPNPYLINPNGPPNAYQFENDFLGFPNNNPQTYEVTSARGFVEDFPDNTKENPGAQNYQQTPPDFRQQMRDSENNYPEEKNNYEIPDYQNEGRGQIPNRDYDSPPETQQMFKPETKSQYQNPEQPSFVTPKTPANVYSFNPEEPVRATSTEAIVPPNQYRPQYRPRGNPMQQINPYEINNQFSEGQTENVELIRTTTPAIVSQRYNNYNSATPNRGRTRSRQRGRITATTPKVVAEENFTVLEEYTARPKSTTTRYTTEVETIPAKVYKLEPQSPTYIQNQAQQNFAPPRQNTDFNYQNNFNQPIIYSRGQEQQQSQDGTPYLPGLINNLQDQAVRPLLVPNLLVPTTDRQTLPPQVPTETLPVTTTELPIAETTTQRRNRGRQRAHSRFSTTSTSAAPRRRRPNYARTTTERQYYNVRTTESTARRVSPKQQRFRTRGRPIPKEQITERIAQTTENTYRQPPLEDNIHAFSKHPQTQQVITVQPQEEKSALKEYHQVYNLPQEEIVTTQKPIIKTTEKTQEFLITTTPNNNLQHVRVNSNVQSGGVIYNNDNDVSTRRTRVRARNRSRFSTTTPKISTTSIKPQTETEEKNLGFIRQPNFNKPAPAHHVTTQQPLPLYSASYKEVPRTIIKLDDDDDNNNNQNQDNADLSNTPPPVQFIGQIQPKFASTTEIHEVSSEAPRPRPKARIRIPNKKPSQQQSYNEVKLQQNEEKAKKQNNPIRIRNRGKNQFKLPENPKTKNDDDDEDVEGGNYPAGYLKNREQTTEKQEFKITIDPSEEKEDDNDQEPHSSLYSPQYVKTDTQWVEATVLPSPNALKNENKQLFTTNLFETTSILTTEDETAETTEIPTTTETIETTTLKKRKIKRRKGVWKLVKHKPVDSFETAESQNYFSVFNSFDTPQKEKTKNGTKSSLIIDKNPIITTTETSIFQTLYNMLGLASKASQIPQTEKEAIEATTTTPSPTFPEEYTEETTTEKMNLEEEETTWVPTTIEILTTEKNNLPWELTNLKTSTSTEISHETEICYKGKCIKSKNINKET